MSRFQSIMENHILGKKLAKRCYESLWVGRPWSLFKSQTHNDLWNKGTMNST